MVEMFQHGSLLSREKLDSTRAQHVPVRMCTDTRAMMKAHSETQDTSHIHTHTRIPRGVLISNAVVCV